MNTKLTFSPPRGSPSRRALPLAVTRLEGFPGLRLLLASESGAAILELGEARHFAVLSHGPVRMKSAAPGAGRAFVDDVARWLGATLGEEAIGTPLALSSDCRWVRTQGEGREIASGWIPFQLELRLGIRAAEVHLRISIDLTRAEFVESPSSNRLVLVEILERSLTGLPPRVVRPSLRAMAANGGTAFELHGFVQFQIPKAWRLTRQHEGHFRLTDPEEEMTIEVSAARLPPLAPGVPPVPELLDQVVKASPYGAAAGPIVAFERDGDSFAWCQYAFDARNTKRPGDPERPAFGRTLIASNAWVHTIITACCWQSDVAIFSRAWEEVLASVALAGRFERAPEAQGEA